MRMSMQILLLLVLPTVTIGAETWDISSPAIVVPYRGHLTRIFQAVSQPDSRYQNSLFGSLAAPAPTIPQPLPWYYYPPMVTLLTNTAELLQSPTSGLYSVRVKLRLRESGYHQQITSLVHSITEDPKSHVLPIPFAWMHIKYSTGDGSYEMRTKWQSCQDDPQVFSLNIHCIRHDLCENIRKKIRHEMPSTLFNVQLNFRLAAQRYPRKAEVSVNSIHLADSPMFASINDQFNASRFVFVENQFYHKLLQQMLTSSLNPVLETDEYVDDEQMVDQMIKLTPVFRHNVTFSGDLSDAMWQATFWPSSTQRPDQKLKDLRSLFSDGTRWFERAMRGDNITADVDSVRSPSLMRALTDLKSPDSTVQWDGQKLIITPMQMVCLDLQEKLRGQAEFRKLFVRISKADADYTVHAGESNEPEPAVAQRQYENLVERLLRVEAALPPIGSIQTFPADVVGSCWIRCDGNEFDALRFPQLATIFPDHRTPDLQGRFLLGFQNGTYPLGGSGGEEKHQLTMEEMPKHNHATDTGALADNYKRMFFLNRVLNGNTDITSNFQTETTFAGGNAPHNNMPPYYTVAYYIRAC